MNYDDMKEKSYLAGHEMAWTIMLHECMRQLGEKGKQETWMLERVDVRVALRRLCLDHDINIDTDDDSLYLADLVDQVNDELHRKEE